MNRNTALTAALVASVFCMPVAADACMHVLRPREDPDVQMLRVVERDLDRQRYSNAARRVLRRFPTIHGPAVARQSAQRRNRPPTLAVSASFERGLRVVALALVRNHGHLRLRAPWSGVTQRQRDVNVAWATDVLSRQYDRTPEDPLARSQFGEALSRSATSRPAARELLEGLAVREVVPESMAWAALADLRDETGDAAGRDQALASCRRIAVQPQTCRSYLAKAHPRTERAIQIGQSRPADVAGAR